MSYALLRLAVEYSYGFTHISNVEWSSDDEMHKHFEQVAPEHILTDLSTDFMNEAELLFVSVPDEVCRVYYIRLPFNHAYRFTIQHNPEIHNPALHCAEINPAELPHEGIFEIDQDDYTVIAVK